MIKDVLFNEVHTREQSDPKGSTKLIFTNKQSKTYLIQTF